MDSQPTTPARRFNAPKIVLAGVCVLLLVTIVVLTVSPFKTNVGTTNKNSTNRSEENTAYWASFGQGLNIMENDQFNGVLISSSVSPFKTNVGITNKNSTNRSEENTAYWASFGQGLNIMENDQFNGVLISSSVNDSFEIKPTKVQSDVCKKWPDSNYTFKNSEEIYFQYSTENNRTLRTISDDSEITQRLTFQRRIEVTKENVSVSRRPKTILTLSPLNNDTKDLRKCPNSKVEEYCNFITAKDEVNRADAVIIRDQDLESLPKGNRSSQIWIYNTLKPENHISNSNMKMLFNLTGTYDFTSHIPMLPLYWSKSQQTNTRELKNYTDLVVRLVVYNKNCTEEEEFFRKYKNIVHKLEDENNIVVEWFNYYNCSGYDYDYNITRKSECLNQSSAECYKTLATLRKFALAFEIYDSDYVSDRFFHPLKNFIIPIAIGSTFKKYSAVSPQNSFIFYCDYKVEDLKEKLKNLNRNQEELEKYFNWRKEGMFLEMSMWYCQVCFMLHRASREGLI